MIARNSALALAIVTAVAAAPIFSIWPASAADSDMEWQFSEMNDPDNKGAMTARLSYAVPETDNIQVSGVCDARPSTGARYSSVTFGTETGDLKEGAEVNLRFSGGGFDQVMRGAVYGTQAEFGVSGVHLDIEHDDPLWAAMLEKDSLDYLIQGYRVNNIDLTRGRDKIKSFIEACRTYAKAVLGDSTNETKPEPTAEDNGSGPSEKEAFNIAKELGTIEGWEAFLSNYSSGFYADLARAYVKKLGGASAAQAPGAGSATPINSVSGLTVAEVRYSDGVFIKNGPTTWVEQRYKGGDALRFNETFRSEQEVKLYDPQRKVHISLLIGANEIWYAPDGSQLTKLYDIVTTAGGVAAPAPPPRVAQPSPVIQPSPVVKPNTQSATSASCKQQNKLRSKNSNTPAKITFINRSGMHRAILWLDFKGHPKSYAALNSGERVTLDTYLTHPWMITDGPGNCIEIIMPTRGTKVVTLRAGKSSSTSKTTSTKTKAKKKKTTKKAPNGCPRGQIRIEGRCIPKQDAASYCGPGYRLQGNKCVFGYQAPPPQAQRPTWQVEAIKKGCAPGLAWNAQEGCHEND